MLAETGPVFWGCLCFKTPVLRLIYKDIPEPPTLRPLFFINEWGAAQERADKEGT